MNLHHRFALGVCCVLALCACGSNGEASCSDPVEEPIDARTSVHVLDPDDGPDDAAPTSGPHIGVGQPGGIYDEAIPAAIQLRILETGQVLVQYRDDADRDDLVDWRTESTSVAPNPDIDSLVVATAWGVRMNCESVDTAALDDFVEDKAPRR